MATNDKPRPAEPKGDYCAHSYHPFEDEGCPSCIYDQANPEPSARDYKVEHCGEVYECVEKSAYDKLGLEVKRLSNEVEELMKVDYWQDRHNIIKAALEAKEAELVRIRGDWGDAEARLHEKFSAALVERDQARAELAEANKLIEHWMNASRSNFDAGKVFKDELTAAREREGKLVALVKRLADSIPNKQQCEMWDLKRDAREALAEHKESK